MNKKDLLTLEVLCRGMNLNLAADYYRSVALGDGNFMNRLSANKVIELDDELTRFEEAF